ncbi:serpin B8-like [Leptodactylus fuscus]|uniref:serpin B8-like n=1 Tax=Leptodactylus fuscus TaxID=238119 RepID=UPI003F4EB3C5
MDICAANNQLAVDVLRQIGGSDVGQNVVFAPLSILTALSMVYLGARGNTAAQMAKVLHISDVQEVHSKCGNLLRELVENNDDYVLKIANKLFGAKTFQFLPIFLNDTKNLYNASLEKLDFLNDPETSRKHINDWITKETQGKIQQLLPDGSISPNTALVLANTLHFDASWSKPFNKMKTIKAPFTKISNEQVMVDMMYITNYFKVKYIANPGIKVVQLPYGSEQAYSMFIVVPDNNSVFKQVEKGFTLEKLNKWISSEGMKMVNVMIQLPKLKIEKSISLKKTLSSLGISDAFSQPKANFSGMTKDSNMFLNEVYQQTSLEVNEKGTEAASATASVMAVRSYPSDEVKADRPFYYAINNNRFGCILLTGIVYDPYCL